MEGAAFRCTETLRVRECRWEGCHNARDLGGGGLRPGLLFRSDCLDHLTPRGWQALQAEGIRTILDLRNEDELGQLPPLPAGLRRVHLPLDGQEDVEFWREWASSLSFGTPLYYGPHLRRMPERSAAVLRAILEAECGIVFHCVLGRDRTGMVALLVLQLLGIPLERMVEDYLLSAQRLGPVYQRRGEPDHGPLIEAHLAGHSTNLSQVTQDFLRDFQADIEALLSAAERGRLRERFREEPA